MRYKLRVISFAFCYFVFINLGYANDHREVYQYVARPENPVKEEEHISITVFVSRLGYVHTEILQTVHHLIEREIESSAQGHFVSGIQKTWDATGQELFSEQTIEIKGAKAVLEIEKNKAIKKKEFRLPRDKVFAVDASLLYLLRAFPFGTESVWNVFMVDFAGPAVTVNVHQDAPEKVTVPAGTFDCYKMEVIVNLWFYQPKIYFWLTKNKPHFLVKQQGKRSPFSKSYITELVKEGE